MIEQFNFDIRLIFAILNGKVSAAINRKLYRNFRQGGLEISPEQWTVLIFLWEKDGVSIRATLRTRKTAAYMRA